MQRADKSNSCFTLYAKYAYPLKKFMNKRVIDWVFRLTGLTSQFCDEQPLLLLIGWYS